MKNILIPVAFCLVFVCTGCYKNNMSNPPGNLTSYDSIVLEMKEDMTLAHEAVPHGIPDSYSWKYYPKIDRGNNVPADFAAYTSWGQLFVDSSQDDNENPAPNTRVAIKDLRTLLLKKNGQWVTLQDLPIYGGLYAEYFSDNINKPAEVRNEPDGSISTTAGDGYNFHFYSDRVPLNAADVRGVVILARAKLILDDPNGTDDRAKSKYILSVGGDYWRSLSAPWKADWSNNKGTGIGRFKRVTNEWRTFYMHTVSDSDFQLFEIPMELLD